MTLLDLAKEAGLKPRLVASTHGGEYHSECPKCGGKDRFYIQPNKQQNKCIGYYRCRQCGIFGDSIEFAKDILNYSFIESLDKIGKNSATRSYMPRLLEYKQKERFKPQVVQYPPAIWREQAGIVVEESHATLLQDATMIQYLNNRGISIEDIKDFKLGLCLSNKQFEASSWGVINKERLRISSGIVIPMLDKGQVCFLKVRRDNYDKDQSKYIIIPGSKNGLNIIGTTKGRKVAFVVESELDGIALLNAVKDFAYVIITGSAARYPDTLTHHLISKVEHLLICHDNDDAGRSMFDKWSKIYLFAKACPVPEGKDIGEAIEHGFNVRNWILQIIPQAEQYIVHNDKAEQNKDWSIKDRELIEWYHWYKNKHSNPRAFARWDSEIALGPEGLKAKSRELQEELKIMKKLEDAKHK